MWKLSVRNAKRQARDYFLYLITLGCAAAFMYAFVSLIFSDLIEMLPGLEVLPYMIIAATVLTVLIMGWFVSYMSGYILKRRSRELSIYMLSGMSAKQVSTLVFCENMLVGLIAFALGIPAGILLSQLLEAVLFHMFAFPYTLRFSFSPGTVGMTLLGFLVILLYAAQKSRKRVRKACLYELLSYDRQNEKESFYGNGLSFPLFSLSVLSCVIGVSLFMVQPFGRGYDILAGTVCMVLFLAGFFQSVPAFLSMRFGVRPSWKYRKNRLTVFRWFTSKIRSMSGVMSVLSVLLMLSLTLMGTGTAVYMISEKLAQDSMFDIMILYHGEPQNHTRQDREYEEYLRSEYPVRGCCSYGVYTDGQTDFSEVRARTAKEHGYSADNPYAEYRSDTCMRQSDYRKLREMLGYGSVELDPSLCYVHCVPSLEKPFEEMIRKEKELTCAGFFFSENGIYSEPFCQSELYGNGLDYILIVPDQAVEEMENVYSLWAAVTDQPLNGYDIQAMRDAFDGLESLRRDRAISTADGFITCLTEENVDYLSGKWSENETSVQVYAVVICLFYLALIFEITGAAVLVVQLLSDRGEKQKSDRILQWIGMEKRMIIQMENRKLFLSFLVPVIPAMIMSACFVYTAAKGLQAGSFRLPAFGTDLWIVCAYAGALGFFVILYGIYFCAAQFSFRKG